MDTSYALIGLLAVIVTTWGRALATDVSVFPSLGRAGRALVVLVFGVLGGALESWAHKSPFWAALVAGLVVAGPALAQLSIEVVKERRKVRRAAAKFTGAAGALLLVLAALELATAPGCSGWSKANTDAAVTTAQTVLDVIRLLAESECKAESDADRCLQKMAGARRRQAAIALGSDKRDTDAGADR